MDTTQFDRLARELSGVTSRRTTLGAVTLGALSLVTAVHLPEVSAKKRRRKTPPLGAFGCLNVGTKCRGNDMLCCSGICSGKKPKKGQKDKRVCAAHDTGGCEAGQGSAFCGGNAGGGRGCTTATGAFGICQTTTGNAGYCRAGDVEVACTRDADCQPLLGPHAACIVCAGAAGGTICSGPDGIVN